MTGTEKGRVTRAARSVRDAVVHEAKETKEAVSEVWRFAWTHDWKTAAKVAFRRKYWGWWLVLAISTALGVVMSKYHDKMVTSISPYRNQIRHAPAAWAIPIVVLIIVSFPPLVGHEVIILASGLVWGLPIGFGIACAGTFLGELACFYAFRHWFTNRARKIEAKHVAYSCLARMMREGGLWMIILVRFSAVPGHVTTAIQSTVGMSVWIYAIAACVSLPKQFALVYLGVVFGSTALSLDEWKKTHGGSPLSDYYSGDSSRAKRHRISLIVFACTTLATLIAGWIVWMRVRKLRPVVIAEMERARAAEARLSGEEPVDVGAPEVSEVVRSTHDLPYGAPVQAGVLSARPPFVSQSSTDGSQIGLLSLAAFQGRMRSDTTGSGWSSNGSGWTTNSSLASPSLPHLPLGEEEKVDYFGLDDAPASGNATPTGSGAVSNGRPRAYSHLRRGSA